MTRQEFGKKIDNKYGDFFNFRFYSMLCPVSGKVEIQISADCDIDADFDDWWEDEIDDSIFKMKATPDEILAQMGEWVNQYKSK